MNCKISCSFGEIVDKVSILKIKSNKSKDAEASKNIQLELDTILGETPLANGSDPLFDELYKINSKLWILEDLIREQSKNKLFDAQYIKYAEDIHKTNDERYNVKRQINNKYGSVLKEEKIYKDIPSIHDKVNNSALTHSSADNAQLHEGKQSYTKGTYQKSYIILKSLIEKFCNYQIFDEFYVDLVFSYALIVGIYNYENKYIDKLHAIMSKIDVLTITNELKDHCKFIYGLANLQSKDYARSFPYINSMNCISGPGVHYKNMSFFETGSTDKTLLLYDGGGIGDKFMYGRFIPRLCDLYPNNRIVFFLNDEICWIFRDIFNHIQNLSIVAYSEPHKMPRFDHHCSLMYLMRAFHMKYDELTFEPIFANLKYKETQIQIHRENKRTYIFNWKGNGKNGEELHNRRMDLTFAIPLFQLTNIHWVVISKGVTKSEQNILDKYGVTFLGDALDNGVNCFEDSIGVIKNANGLISTDTSLVHLSANLNVPTTALLTCGCEWRWTRDDTTKWYPDVTLIRQHTQGDWKNVIDRLIQTLFKGVL